MLINDVLVLAAAALLLTTALAALGGLLPPRRIGWARVLWRLGAVLSLAGAALTDNFRAAVPLAFACMALGFLIACVSVAARGHDGTSEARPGSLLLRAASSRAPFGLGIALTGLGVTGALDSLGHHGSPGGWDRGALVAGVAMLIFAWVRGARAAITLLEAAREARPAEVGKVSSLRTIDVGIGDATWIAGGVEASSYRDGGVAARIVRGDVIEGARAVLATAVRRAPMVVIASLSLGMVLGQREPKPEPKPEIAPPPSSTAKAAPATDAPHFGFHPQPGPILADVDDDGIEDVIALRWDSAHEDAALMVIANSGRSLQPIWATPGFPSQWASRGIHLARSGNKLFVTDSERRLRIIDVRTGAIVGATDTAFAHLLCGLNQGPPRAYVEGDWNTGEGEIIDAAGKKTPAKRPADCTYPGEHPPCPAAEGVVCRAEWPAWLKQEAEYGAMEQLGDAGVTVGVATVYDPKRAGAQVQTLWGHDPRTRQKRWREPLVFTRDQLHGEPMLAHALAGGRVFVSYQTKDGQWQIGARDAKSGEILWRRSPSNALLGASFHALTATATGLYVSIDHRLEIFDAASGRPIGVIR